MSRAHQEAADLLDGLLGRSPDQEPPTLQELDYALERIEELSKEAMDDQDEAYLDAAGETILGLRARILSGQGS
jgi:hypothetical protein